MSGRTHSSSGISKTKKKDSKNVAEPALPLPQSQVCQTNRSNAAAKAWETRCAKAAAAKDASPNPEAVQATATQSTRESQVILPVSNGEAVPCGTQPTPVQDKPVQWHSARTHYHAFPVTIHDRYKSTVDSDGPVTNVPYHGNAVPSIQVNGTPTLSGTAGALLPFKLNLVKWDIQVADPPINMPASYQPQPQQSTFRVMTQDYFGSKSSRSHSLTPAPMNDNCLSPALSHLSGHTRLTPSSCQPSPLVLNGNCEDHDGDTHTEDPACWQDTASDIDTPSAPTSSQSTSGGTCQDVKEEKVVVAGHTKAALRKDMKMDPRLNSRLADDTFRRSGISPFEIQKSVVATPNLSQLVRDIKSWRIGPSIDRVTIQENVKLALSNSNFAFCTYSSNPSNVKPNISSCHPAVTVVLDFTFALKELKPVLPLASVKLREKLQSLGLQIKYILNQYKSGTLAEPQSEFTSSEHSNDWAKILASLNQWRTKPDRVDDWNRISKEYGQRALTKLGLSENNDDFIILETD
ncbi:uncharacterized protein EI90DRAFT_3023129 [Cantharellus anzutake]|uniref:uncharacterized protein n=1 Tax=Cantharellus anzutake TaxID=1750568 RepID=UPI001906B1C1|nr:uncharacterized protein EI90DRAFT_3023129 [Cantharellus anzutake]KAF8312302.1 hypothetical protein EI90DRAFT_3023129 [Cantharellus anzutake]